MKKTICKLDGVSYECFIRDPETVDAGVVICPAEKLEGHVVIPSQVVIEGMSYPVTVIGYRAFSGMEIKSVTCPDSVLEIEDSAFENCSNLVRASLGKALRRIGASAFASCKWLSTIDLPGTVMQVGSNALEGTRLVDLQRGVVYVGHILYGYNGYLPEHSYIEVREGTTVVADSAFNCRFSAKEYGNLEGIMLPSGVKRIGDSAFLECKGLKHVNLPRSLEYIGTSSFSGTLIREVSVPWRKPCRLITTPFDSHTVIRVPKGTVTAYKEAKGWGDHYEFIEK